jgi:hypothetical protein
MGGRSSGTGPERDAAPAAARGADAAGSTLSGLTPEARRAIALAALLGAAPALAAPRSARAQVARATVDVGAAAAGERLDGEAPVFVDAAASVAWLPFGAAARVSSAPYSSIPGGTYGAVSLAGSVALGGGWFATLGATGGTGERDALFGAARRDLEIVPTLSRGAWTISARAGESRLTDWEERDASRLELLVRRDFRRGWATLSAVRATFSDTATVQRETTYVVAGFPFRSRVESTGSVDRGYEMGQAEVGGMLGRTHLVARLGVPLARTNGARYETWGSATAAIPVGPRAALVATAGRHPGVPEQRLRASSYVTVGLRFSSIPYLTRAPVLVPAEPNGGDRLDAGRFQAIAGAGGAQLLVLTGVHGERVDVNGDFTSWEPVTLERVGTGVWQRTLPIPPGAHRIVISVDGGEWRPPPGLPISRDGFGEEAGILYVPE